MAGPARSESQSDSQLRQFFARRQSVVAEWQVAVDSARPALARLVEVCRNKTGQSYKLRALLFSLWNGKPADLLETICLDWELKRDLCAVILAFGHDVFFYDAIFDAFVEGQLLEWFIEEGKR